MNDRRTSLILRIVGQKVAKLFDNGDQNALSIIYLPVYYTNLAVDD